MPSRRTRRLRVIGVMAALTGLPLLGACGSSGSGSSVSASARLHVTLNPTGGTGPVQSWDVTCPSATHASACAALTASPDAFTAPPATTACTMIYGGPQVLTVDGSVGTRRINYTTGRTNGCEIAAFARDIALVAPFRRG
jgi:hypothetical protein